MSALGGKMSHIEISEQEHAQLRADSKWSDEYHERLQNLRIMLDCSINDLPKRCAQLRATSAELDTIETCPECGEYTDEYSLNQWKECRACAMQSQRDEKAAELAAASTALEQARQLISVINQRVYLKRDLQVKVNHWLAAHAPQAEQEQMVVDKV